MHALSQLNLHCMYKTEQETMTQNLRSGDEDGRLTLITLGSDSKLKLDELVQIQGEIRPQIKAHNSVHMCMGAQLSCKSTPVAHGAEDLGILHERDLVLIPGRCCCCGIKTEYIHVQILLWACQSL